MKIYASIHKGRPDTLEIEKNDKIRDVHMALTKLDSPGAIKTLIWNKRSAPTKSLRFNITLPGLERAIICSGTKEIGTAAFCCCKNLWSVNLPEGLTTIRYQAFAYSGLKNAILPKTISVIEGGAFSGCRSLGVIRIPKDAPLTTLPPSFAARTDICEFTCPTNLVEIGLNAFYQCKKLEGVVLNEGLRRIYGMAFTQTAITELHLPSTFECCSPIVIEGLKKFTIPDDSPRAAVIDGMLVNDAHELVSYPPLRLKDGVLTLPEGIRGVHAYAMVQMAEVKVLNLPASFAELSSKGNHLNTFFSNSLERITVSCDNPLLADRDGILYSKDGTKLLLYPAKYKSENYIVPATIRTVGQYAFCHAEMNSLTFLGDIMLQDCALGGVSIGRCTFCGNVVTAPPPNSPTPLARFREIEFCGSLPEAFATTSTMADLVYAPQDDYCSARQLFDPAIRKPRLFIQT